MKKTLVRDRVDYIIDACRGKHVLHVGCADTPYTQIRLERGTLLHAAIEKVATVQYGIDSSEEGIAILRRSGFENLAVVNVEDLSVQSPFGQVEYDVVIAGEILEHLSNPGLFLDSIKPLLKQSNGLLVVTTINATNAFRILYMLLKGDEHVHPDHTSYYSRKTLIKLLSLHKFEVEDFAYYDIGMEHSAHIKGHWYLLLLADRFGTWLRPGLASGVMASCRISQL